MPFLIALIVGAASAFAFQPVGWWPLMILAIAALCELVARADKLRSALLIGWGFGVGQFLVGLNWIPTAFTFQAAMPVWLGWVAVLLLSLYLALYPMLAVGLAWRFGKTSRLALVLALAGAWTLAEWLRATMFTGFAWNPIGVTLVGTPWLAVSQWIGTYSMSGLVVFAAGALWLALRKGVRPAVGIGVVLAVLALVPFAGLKHTRDPRPIRIVQPNIGQQLKWIPGYEQIASARLNKLSRVRDKRQELIFWPEAAVTQPLSDNRPGAASYILEERSAATEEVGDRDLLLTGGLAFRSSDRQRIDGAANSVFVLGPGGGERPRLLFWPEAAVTEPLDDQRAGPPAAFAAYERAQAASVLQDGEYLLTGGIGVQSKDGRTVSGATNSIFVLAPGGKMVGRYDKAHLVPYGEYLPMRPLLSAIGLSRLAPGDLDFQPGPGAQSLALPEGWGTAGFQLCYEIIFSGHVVDRQHRPDFIFNPSNDAWFGSWGPPQHLAQARLRAAEEGIPVIRSTPTGISALVDAHGRLIDSIPLGKAGIIWGYLPPSAPPTLFSRLGNVIPLALGFLMLIAAIALDRRARYRRI
jgi:apolipoprotein N-acyltransferase